MIILLCLLIPAYALSVENNVSGRQDVDPITTESGPVRGVALGQTDILQYFDIPYGQFDTNHPFQEPVKPEAWETILSKDRHSSKCPQIQQNDEYIGNNDCLTLSVFAKIGVENADVLFHIHDGDFVSGSGDPEVYNPQQLVSEGIIVVLPNYRLGPLGFMCWQNETVPGNAGIKDLALALQWVKNNIKAFGGNTSNIVVSGVDTAGILVDFLVLVNQTSKYISKGITESGFALSHKALDRDPLRTADGKVNVNDGVQSIITSGRGIHFKPCIDNRFITNSFWNLLQTQKIDIPLMIGSTNQAGMDYVTDLNDVDIQEFRNNLSLILPTDLRFEGNQEREVIEKVKRQYFGDSDISINLLERISLCFTDSTYLNPGIREARLLTKAGGTVYFYELSYTGDKQNPIPGTPKGDSLRYIFTQSTMQQEHKVETQEGNVNENESAANTIRTLWTNFIRNGIPSASNVDWKAFDATEGNEKSLMIGAKITLTNKLHAERMKLWDEIYERYFVETNLGSTVKSSILVILISLVTSNIALTTL
ncbi:para-nitrobenzyl esterase-like [Pieris brassicae]|uniref:para-nitrobenzyl esterase-like n=1 Tax=Pieris brassicae TaxID=7116 RepID=UPI001E6618C5|nr:para-nitrobenzyl esterase-like [Pieris brassicae]